MTHPEAVIEKAKQIELLLNRVEVGEPFEQVLAELGFAYSIDDLPKLQAKYVSGGRSFEVLIDGRYGHWQTVNSAVREWLYERKKQAEELSAPQLANEMEKKFEVRVAAGHINYLLRKRGLTNRTGRPKSCSQTETAQAQQEFSEQIDENAGLFFPGSSQTGNEDCGSSRSPD
jgi:hypothetical protein